MTAKQIDKEVQRQAALFEDNCVKGKVLNENIRFSKFAALWFADRKNDLRPRTYERYEGMLPRINAAIGHIKLCRLQPPHLRAFYINMLNTAVEWGMLYSNPCDRTKTPKAETKEAKYIDEVQT